MRKLCNQIEILLKIQQCRVHLRNCMLCAEKSNNHHSLQSSSFEENRQALQETIFPSVLRKVFV